MVIVVDEWVDVHDYGEVAWQVGANADPGRDVEQAHGPLDQLDHAPSLQALGGKLGLDATATWPGEGYPREWPEVARMSDEVRRQVDERWDSLGIALPSAPGAARAPTPGATRMAPLVAVLGASRFLGRLAIPLFVAEGWRVRALDRRQAAIAGMLGVERDWADPLDERSLTRATTDCACVLDLSSSECRRRRRRGDGGRSPGGRRGPGHPRRAAGHADRLARGRSGARHGGALRTRDRGRRALGRAARCARRPAAGDPVPGLDAPRDGTGRRGRRGAGRRLAGRRAPRPTPTATTSPAVTAPPIATCSPRSRPRTAGGRAWSTPASRATSSRAWRSASRRAASPRSRRSPRRCRRPSRSRAATPCCASPTCPSRRSPRPSAQRPPEDGVAGSEALRRTAVRGRRLSVAECRRIGCNAPWQIATGGTTRGGDARPAGPHHHARRGRGGCCQPRLRTVGDEPPEVPLRRDGRSRCA